MAEDVHRSVIDDACRKLAAWLISNGWESYDCFDGASSPLARFVSPLKTLGIRLLIQLVKRSPLNLRPLLGIPKTVSAKSVGFLASGYSRLCRIWKELRYEHEARRALDWLTANRAEGYSGACWGYPFDVYTRSTVYLAGTPTVVATAFIGQAFVDAYEHLGDSAYLSVARSACDFILRDLPGIRDGDSICIPYHPDCSVPVHNANLLAVALLSRVYRHTGEQELKGHAHRALSYSLKRQLPNGAWYYGEMPDLRWVDGFHTGFVLDSLLQYVDCTGDCQPLQSLQRGLSFYKEHLFLSDGEAKYTDKSVYPIDVRCAAQAIQSFALLRNRFPQCVGLMHQVAHWAIRHLQDSQGYFYYQKTRWFTNRIPYIRWSQGPMLAAFATYLGADRGGYRAAPKG